MSPLMVGLEVIGFFVGICEGWAEGRFEGRAISTHFIAVNLTSHCTHCLSKLSTNVGGTLGCIDGESLGNPEGFAEGYRDGFEEGNLVG